MHVYVPIVPGIFVPCTDNTTLTLQWKGNNGVAQLGLKGHDNKCDKPQSDAGHKKRKRRQKNNNFSSHSNVGVWSQMIQKHHSFRDELQNLHLAYLYYKLLANRINIPNP